MTDHLLPTALAGLLVVAAVLGLAALARDRARLRRDLDQRQHDVERLTARVDSLAAAASLRRRDPEEFVITGLGQPEPEPVPAPERIDGRLFADIVLRETVVKAAALTHGVRRALAPEVVWRVRGEVRRELRRARKQRKAELKRARREWAARANTPEEGAA